MRNEGGESVKGAARALASFLTPYPDGARMVDTAPFT
jgi:hypothetical protein